jgi:methionyl-tRNA formyltransferase
MQEAANTLGIPLLRPEKLRDENFIEQLRSYHADIFCVVAYKILPREVFTMPKYGTFNVHTSLLPKYRGAAPMNRAIINGEAETGVTTFLLDEKVDTGNILLQESVPIREDETVGELHDELMQLGAKLSLETIKGLAMGTLSPKPQDNEGVTSAPKIFPEDCIIDFTKTALEIYNKIRGLSPYPTAVALLPNGERLKIFRAVIAEGLNEKYHPGEFKASDNNKRLFVGTATLPLELLEVQRENKKQMSAEEFLRGARNIFT